jgi:ribosome-associated heat shock protein Hsp15
VQVNGVAVKPARELKPGDSIQLRSGPVMRTITVLGISDKRGPAPVATKLYQETEDSIAQRLQAAEQRRLAPEPALTLLQGRPTKRDRRDTEKARENLRGGEWNDRWSAAFDK